MGKCGKRFLVSLFRESKEICFCVPDSGKQESMFLLFAALGEHVCDFMAVGTYVVLVSRFQGTSTTIWEYIFSPGLG